MLITQVGKVKMEDTSAASRLRFATTTVSGRRASERVTGREGSDAMRRSSRLHLGADAALGRSRRKRRLNEILFFLGSVLSA